MSEAVKVLEGIMDVELDLEYSFTDMGAAPLIINNQQSLGEQIHLHHQFYPDPDEK